MNIHTEHHTTTPSGESVILSTALRMKAAWDRYSEADDAVSASSSGTHKINCERVKSTAYAQQLAAVEIIMAEKATNATEAAIQLALVNSNLDCLRSPGKGIDAEQLQGQIERCLYSVLGVLAQSADADLRKYGVNVYMNLKSDPFLPLDKHDHA